MPESVAQVGAIDPNRRPVVRVNRHGLKIKRSTSTIPQHMTWLDKLERRFGFLGVPGLVRIVVGFAALVFALAWLLPGFTSVLQLDPVRIGHGEVWRLVTYIFIPQTLSPWWILFALWFLWFIGDGLEQAWGAFRLTLYFFVGMIGTTAAAFFFGARFFMRHGIAARFQRGASAMRGVRAAKQSRSTNARSAAQRN